MSDPTTPRTWMARVARRMSSSSAARVLIARVATCVLDLLGHARPQAHAAVEPLIWGALRIGGIGKY